MMLTSFSTDTIRICKRFLVNLSKVFFIFKGDAPSTQSPYGEYPLVVRPDDDPSRTVLVVQSYAYGIYLGHLHVTFDETGEVDSFDGNPIFLDSTVGKGKQVCLVQLHADNL